MKNEGKTSIDVDHPTSAHIASTYPTTDGTRDTGTLVKPIARYSLAHRPAIGRALELRELPAAARDPVCADGINHTEMPSMSGNVYFKLPQEWVSQYFSSFLEELAGPTRRSRSTTPDLHPNKARCTSRAIPGSIPLRVRGSATHINHP